MILRTDNANLLIDMKSRFLCMDTCVILDIIRDPTRSDIRPQEQIASLELLHLAERGEDLIVLVAEQVHKEFHDNVDTVQEEARNALSRFREMASKLDQLSKLHGALGKIDLSHLENHEIRCRNVADRWLTASTSVHQSEQIVLRAFKRANLARTPAKRGKDSIKDCVILETYLEHIRKLRHDSITSPVVFVSSNTKDYAGTGGAVIRDDIRFEFDDLELKYAPNLSAAKHFLRF